MQRDVQALASNSYDLLVVGAGVYGLFAAWDAAMRGLRVALIDRGDFGNATSSNSLRVIHGGLRYLQHGDIRRMRTSIRERATLMRIAPDLVHPLPFLIPTYGWAMKGKPALTAAVKIHDIVGFDRNKSRNGEARLESSRSVSKEECLRIAPGLDPNGLTGGVIYYDCQTDDSERLMMSIAHSADQAGAEIANYVSATELLRGGGRVEGVRARDELTGDEFDIHARVVLNACGPWVEKLWNKAGDVSHQGTIGLSKAFNILIDREINGGFAIGAYGTRTYADRSAIVGKSSRMLFFTPWHGMTMVGTEHLPYEGDPDDFGVTEQEIQAFVDGVNNAYEGLNLRRDGIIEIYSGLLPSDGTNGGDVQLTKAYKIYDHAREHGLDGLISMLGVKFTESRHVAEKAVDLAARKLGRRVATCRTATTPLARRKLVAREYGNDSVESSVVHAVKNEMAQKLGDVIYRRLTPPALREDGQEFITTCARVMAHEMGWNLVKTRTELEEVGVAAKASVEAC